MAHIHGRTVKNVEAPRPLKSASRTSIKANFMVIDEIITLIENTALNLQSGIISPEQMAMLVQNLRINGPQVESVAKEPLERAFVVFRNASQDERLNIMTRLNLLELIELRAKGWVDNGFNSYYKTKQANELPEAQLMQHPQYVHTAHAAGDGTYISTSPSFGGGATAGGMNNFPETVASNAAILASVGSPQQTHLLLSPGEVIGNSGKFLKPTKIPGKTYCKDEVVIRNSDSGKVMGIKGRRVHMIEELSETIISFQRVNPGAKERLVQITGPGEDKINYAKQLIEDTIRRNASPVRWEPAPAGAGAAAAGGSCSSLASSNSDEHVQLRSTTANNTLANRLSFNSAQNFMTASAAAQHLAAMQQQNFMNMGGPVMVTSPTGPPPMMMAGAKGMRPNQQILLHSYSTNDASVGEYKYTVTVGQHVLKITGDSCDLVRSAKLVLDDYFSSAEFLASREAGATFDGNVVSPMSTPSTPMGGGPPHFMMGTPISTTSTPLADSGVGLNYMSSNSPHEGDDEVFAETNANNGGLVRSRRSHFSRKESSPENASSAGTSKANKKPASAANSDKLSRIVFEVENLLYYAQSPHSWALPADWAKICEKFPSIVRNKDESDETNRFDGEKYLKLIKTSGKRNLDSGNDETTEETDPTGDNE